jgi:hypothetical protein
LLAPAWPRTCYILSLFIFALKCSLLFANFNSSGSLFQGSTTRTAKEYFRGSVRANFCISRYWYCTWSMTSQCWCCFHNFIHIKACWCCRSIPRHFWCWISILSTTGAALSILGTAAYAARPIPRLSWCRIDLFQALSCMVPNCPF